MRTIETTASRLEMSQHLASLLGQATPEETPIIAYMLLGGLAPEHEGLEVGLAEKWVEQLVRTRTGASEQEIAERMAELGDLGYVAEALWQEPRGGQVALDSFGASEQAEPTSPSVEALHAKLVAIARIEGTGSQDKKLGHALRLLDKASPLEACYLVRFLVGKLRLGVADMTLLDGAAIAFAPGEAIEEADDGLPRPPVAWREAMERAYNLTSDIGEVLSLARSHGLEALQDVHITPGKPVRPMLAERQSDGEEIFKNVGSPALAEFKYDGLRTQAHLANGEVHLYSRRLEHVTRHYPDVVEAIQEAFQGHDVVVEGEAVPVDPETGEMREFQAIARRRGRKHGLEQAMREVPIHLYLFDILYADGVDLTIEPLEHRRAKLDEIVQEHARIQLSEAHEVADPSELEPIFEESVARNAEGLMVKKLGDSSSYQAGARGWRWVKYKKDYVEELADSLDLVIVGAYHGKGRRAGWYGTLLGAAYNPAEDRWETVCKIGTGFTDETLATLNDVLDAHKIPHPPRHVEISDDLDVEVFFEPEVVAEIRGAEMTRSPVHTAAEGPAGGIALRFPRFIRWREEKGPRDATTVDEVQAMYDRQFA